MPDTVRIGSGTILRMSDAAFGSFTTIAEVESIGEIAEVKPEINATPLNATAVRYITGLTDGQEIEVALFLLSDNVTQNAATLGAGLRGVFLEGTARDFIVAPKGMANQFRFRGTITRHAVGGFNAGDPMRRRVGIRVSGDVIEEANTANP